MIPVIIYVFPFFMVQIILRAHSNTIQIIYPVAETRFQFLGIIIGIEFKEAVIPIFLAVMIAGIGGPAVIEIFCQDHISGNARNTGMIIRFFGDAVACLQIQCIAMELNRIMPQGNAIFPMITMNAITIPTAIFSIQPISKVALAKVRIIIPKSRGHLLNPRIISIFIMTITNTGGHTFVLPGYVIIAMPANLAANINIGV